MSLISSRWTWWHKKAVPAIWFGFLGVAGAGWLFQVIWGQAPVGPLLIPVSMAIFGYLLMRWLVFPLVDQVWIDENDVMVRNRGTEDRFPLSNVVRIRSYALQNPEWIVLVLKEPSTFGSEIAFAPPDRWRFMSPAPHPVALMLMARIGQK